MIEVEPPTVEWALSVMVNNSGYEGGLNGTCAGCRFATGPVRQDGSPAEPWEYDNDETEAYYLCGMTTRDPEAENPSWGEYSPCLAGEWAHWIAAEGERMRPVVEAAQKLMADRSAVHGDPSNPEWWQGHDWSLVRAVAEYEKRPASVIKFEVAELPPACGAPSSKSRTAMRCELPPDHPEQFHNGRNRLGVWRTWPLDDPFSRSLFKPRRQER